MSSREFDLVVYGATGFVGRQAVAHLTAHAPRDLRWAVAGRDATRLAALGAPVPALVADATAPGELAALAGRTRVVVSFAGPFALYGDLLVEACIAAGTHYCDISGDLARIRRLIDRHDAAARAAHVRIVPFAGLCSLPADLAVHLLDRKLDGGLTLAKAILDPGNGTFSGGTVASMIDAVDSGDEEGERDPMLLGPPRSPDPVERDPRGLRYDRDLRAWVAASPTGLSDTRAVRLSATLSGRPGLRFQEYLAFPGPLGVARTVTTRLLLAVMHAAVRRRPTRALLTRLTPPGAGPSAHQVENGRLRLRVWGSDASGRTAEVSLLAPGDPGSRVSAIGACECALLLATRDAGPHGLITPSVAFGEELAVRLRTAGFTIA
ncbi:saccharopine dehydrogenase family protein [Catenuloplanes japonicus]|uniref:saccharopine dehydrogenase family protein n=1 Tax=Catenuloplanes japonicus TaxID=33876 RepID=UPI00052510DC|nr:saccharopine dehydrogenase NADP-binding domain-containing protein [Catenuloplanes japonicus]